MHALDEHFVTVTEAASLLRVSPSTIRRWIQEGDLPAYRFGRRRVALKRAELSTLITPARPATRSGDTSMDDEEKAPRRWTPEEKQRAAEAMERAKHLSQEIFEQRGGKLFPPAWETLAELRDERTRQLP